MTARPIALACGQQNLAGHDIGIPDIPPLHPVSSEDTTSCVETRTSVNDTVVCSCMLIII